MIRLNLLCIFLFAFLTSGSIHAQRSKKVFLDQNDEVISRGQYKKRLSKASGKLLDIGITDSDTLKVRKLFWREHEGKLNSIALQQLRNYLQSLSGKPLPEANYIVINYYPGQDECNQGSYNDYKLGMIENYEKALRILGNTSQFYIHEKDAPNPFKSKENRSLQDHTNLFKNVFFPYPFPCDSFVVIHPDGRYIKYYGEHHLQTIVDIVQADWELDFFWD